MDKTTRIDYTVEAGGPLAGKLEIPGDKSISHRALMLGAVADGITTVRGFLEGDDTIATLDALRSMGVEIEYDRLRPVIIHGVGLHGLKDAGEPLYLGNSGTSVRLLAGLLAGQEFDSELTGDESLQRRPMRRIVEPLRQMGAEIRCNEQGTLPITIKGGRKLMGISYQLPVASAQIKSALLLAGLYASGTTCVAEPGVTRDHTEHMLAWFGRPVERRDQCICIDAGPLTGRVVEVPADISSAAFFMVAAAVTEGSELMLYNIGVNPTRSAVIDILKAMGADIRLENGRELCGEPVADIRVRYSKLHGIDIPGNLVPVAIDEFPILFIAAACAEGRTTLSGAAELRVKESDRIAVMAEGLSRLGIGVKTLDDGMIIEGGRLQGGIIDTHGDHRIAMAFAVAGLASRSAVTVKDCANIDTSFPGFAERMQALGIHLAVIRDG